MTKSEYLLSLQRKQKIYIETLEKKKRQIVDKVDKFTEQIPDNIFIFENEVFNNYITISEAASMIKKYGEAYYKGRKIKLIKLKCPNCNSELFYKPIKEIENKYLNGEIKAVCAQCFNNYFLPYNSFAEFKTDVADIDI